MFFKIENALTIFSYGAQHDMVSKKANINDPKIRFGAQMLFFMYLVISFTNEGCTLAKSSNRNSTVFSASNKSF